MAHFKRGNLQLKTNQEIQLGDSQESLIKYDGSLLTLTNDGGELALDSTGITVIGAVTANSYYGNGSHLTDVIADLVNDISPQLGGDLDANGNVILLDNGTEAAPGLAFGSSPGTGLWYDYKLHISHNGDEIIQMFYNSGQNVSYIQTEALPSNQDTADLVLKTAATTGTGVAGDARLEGGVSSPGGTSGHARVVGGNSSTGQAGDVVLTPGTAGDPAGEDGAVNITQTEAPPVTTDRLYNLAGDLTWNGKDLTSELYYAGDLKLATDSTGVAVIGDISCNDLYVSGNTIFVGTGEIKSTAGNVELNYSGSKVVETIATGLQAGVSTFDIKTSGGEDGITINNDGAVELFYNNIKALETIAGGISVFDTNGDDPNIRFYSDAASLVGEIKIINGDMKLDVGFATYIDIASGGAVSLYYDEEKRFETTSSGATVTGDLQLTGVMDADSLDYAKVGTPTYSTGQEAMDQLGSAGVISGGVISEDSTAQVSITAGTGLIRTSNSDNAPIVFIDWSGTSLHIPEDADKAIVVKYNAGSPAVFAEDPANVNTNNMIVLGEVETLDGALFFSNTRQRAGNFNAKLLERLYDTTPVVRANHSGLILGDSADNNRYVTMTAGDVWNLLELDSIAAIDTGVTDEYTRYWSDGGVGWNTLIGQTIWPNAQYDNGTGTLASLASDRYTSLWFYLIPSDNTLHMLYGVTNDKNLAVAEAEPAPNDLPVILREFSVLIGRFIIKGSLTLATEVQTAFDDTINLTASTNHSNLSNLDVDDHTQYSLVTGARDFTGTVGGIDPVAATDFVTLQYMATLGTDRTRLTYDGTTDLDISIEHIVDIKYADFQPGLDAPPWQEGRVFWDKENHTFGVYNDVEDVTLQVGQESHLRVRNISGQIIPNGSPVYITGADEGLPTIDLAKSDNIETVNAVTIATHDIDNTSNGYTTVTGAVNEIDTSNFNPGDSLYVSDSTAGVITNVRPKSPSIAHRVGVATDIGVVGRMVSDSHPAADQMQVLTYSMPLKGVVDAVVPLTGTLQEVAAGATTDITTPFAVSNQHLYIYVNSLTGSGNVAISGAQLSENSSVQDSTGVEIITIDQAGTYYQTSFKWWEILSIEFPPGISAINFDYGGVGYPDMGNRNFSIIGYRCDAYADKVGADFSVLINKIQDDGDGKMSIVPLENIGVDDAGAGIVDNLRTGVDDRSYLPNVASVWPANTILTLKQLDFNTYFTSQENDILSKTKDEGFAITIDGEPPGGLSDVDYIVLYLYYELIP